MSVYVCVSACARERTYNITLYEHRRLRIWTSLHSLHSQPLPPNTSSSSSSPPLPPPPPEKTRFPSPQTPSSAPGVRSFPRSQKKKKEREREREGRGGGGGRGKQINIRINPQVFQPSLDQPTQAEITDWHRNKKRTGKKDGYSGVRRCQEC